MTVSALNGAGIVGLKELMATVLAELWAEIDVSLPYSAGELLSRVRERGALEFDYQGDEVRIRGRVPPAMAGDLQRAAAAHRRS